MVTADDTLNQIHTNIHAIRLQGSAYKPTQLEQRISYLICEYYYDKCSECRNIIDIKKQQANEMIKGGTPQNKGFFDKLLGK